MHMMHLCTFQHKNQPFLFRQIIITHTTVYPLDLCRLTYLYRYTHLPKKSTTNLDRYTTWMSQEFGKWLVNGL